MRYTFWWNVNTRWKCISNGPMCLTRHSTSVIILSLLLMHNALGTHSDGAKVWERVVRNLRLTIAWSGQRIISVASPADRPTLARKQLVLKVLASVRACERTSSTHSSLKQRANNKQTREWHHQGLQLTTRSNFYGSISKIHRMFLFSSIHKLTLLR